MASEDDLAEMTARRCQYECKTMNDDEYKRIKVIIATTIITARAEGEAGMAVAVQLLRELRSVLFVLPQSERTQSLIIRVNDVEDNAADPDFLSRREDVVRAETWEKAIAEVRHVVKGWRSDVDESWSERPDLSFEAADKVAGAIEIVKSLEAAAGSKVFSREDEQKNQGR